MTHVHFFFSVHEKLFSGVAEQLVSRYGVTRLSGFVWGNDQRDYLGGRSVHCDPLIVFSTDILERSLGHEPDIAYLISREAKYGISLQRMIASERHLIKLPYRRLLSVIELTFRRLESFFEEDRPDFVFSESVSCLTSYIYLALARAYDVPFWQAMSARMDNRLAFTDRGLQQWQLTTARFEDIQARGLTADEREQAEGFIAEFRRRPSRPSHMKLRQELKAGSRKDAEILWSLATRRLRDEHNPTLSSPMSAVASRAGRIVRAQVAEHAGIFERPVSGESYVLYPIHFQPEATTLVQAPYYLDQAALIEDIVKSLPIGYRLYVKEHFTNRGRRPIGFYRRIKKAPGVRLLGPDEDSWKLLAGASAIATITGSMGWEGLLMAKPVVTFGEVFYAECPLVHRAREHAKDEWYDVFRAALTGHQHDEEMLTMFVSAVLETTYPGLVKNSETFPRVLEATNVENVSRAFAAVSGLSSESR